ncbi:acyl-CoA thioester hydrolase [Modicisalibacter muralis]|uniref:Acyl-CoA thioester hydrolase n=1 Tax=Modicisalibacter muralis TaxID=119000 RepID=A0A1G9KKI3_9GAMM|nr:thioesterase family protein [Halomonas muralis]SDL50169.1 acyl-CoA thioester hydrolase [Halomonas muralis]
MRLLDTQVDAAWVDYNGHMNDAEYARVFSLAVDELMVRIGLDAAGREREGYTLFTLETHLCYRREAHEGEALMVDLALLDRDAKRLHAFFTLYNAEQEAVATSEQMLMGIATASGRPAPFPDAVSRQLDSFPVIDSDAWPEAAGRRIGITRR